MTHQGLPVAGYKAQTDDNVAIVNCNKELEERVLHVTDDLMLDKNEVGSDRRWLAVGRTHIEQGFMAINRSVFQPGLVLLPEDILKYDANIGCGAGPDHLRERGRQDQAEGSRHQRAGF